MNGIKISLLCVLAVVSWSCSKMPFYSEDQKEGNENSAISIPLPKIEASNKLEVTEDSTFHSMPKLPLRERIILPTTQQQLSVHQDELLYTFKTNYLPITTVLDLFSKAYGLNIIVDADVVGDVKVDFQHLTFHQAMSAILETFGYYWEKRNELVFVKSRETRVFHIDYIRLVRSGAGSSQAQVSSGGASNSEEDGGEVAGTIIIGQEDKVDFWSEVEAQLALMISENGRLVVNRLAGTIQVTDQHRRVNEVEKYVKELNDAIYRQVDIEVKIVEVTFNDDQSLGINWDFLFAPGSLGDDSEVSFSGIITQPAGGGSVLPPTLDFFHNNTSGSGSSFGGIISALKQQGDVNIVSQPRIRTLNNQAALIKVGTDRTFFRKEQVTDSTTSGSQILSSDVPEVVTEGIVLSLTPQISKKGWITLDVSPVVTRVSSVSEVVDNSGAVSSSAPNLDISQTSSLIRARSGETVIIGGLIQSQETEATRSIPGLRHIPGLKYLFNGTYITKVKRELVMFVTPRLVDETDYGILEFDSWKMQSN